MNFNKRKCLKFARVTAWILLGIIIGSGSIVLWYCYSKTTFKDNVIYDPWQIANYLFGIIGSIGTLLAVIVALAKEAIMKWLYSPSFNISLVDNGVTENIANENQRVPEASSYECYAKIENTGSIAAIGCKVFISEIKYGKNATNLKTLQNIKNKQMRWISAEVDMPVSIPNKIKLFEIVNPNLIGTPQGSTEDLESTISFNGCELKSSQIKKGFWDVSYFICCKNGDVTKFNATIEWNGTFKSRATDMAEVLKIQIKEQ